LSDQGNPRAQNEYGVILINGELTEQNSQLGIALLHKAANDGNIFATANLGRVFEFGLGAEIDLVTAFMWYSKASEMGDSTSSFAAGYFCENGYGLPKSDYQQAVKYYSAAVDEGHILSMYRLALIKYDYLSIYRSELELLRASRVSQGKQTSRLEKEDLYQANELRIKLREMKYEEDMLRIKIKTELDKKIERNTSEAVSLFEMAASSNHKLSQYELGKHHFRECRLSINSDSTFFKPSPYHLISAYKWLSICHPSLQPDDMESAESMLSQLTDNMDSQMLAQAKTAIEEVKREFP
jgi:TPR repeat protein